MNLNETCANCGRDASDMNEAFAQGQRSRDQEVAELVKALESILYLKVDKHLVVAQMIADEALSKHSAKKEK